MTWKIILAFLIVGSIIVGIFAPVFDDGKNIISIITEVEDVEYVPTVHGAWWNDNWRYYRLITIDPSYIGANLQYFPVLVVIDDATADKCDGGNSIRFLNVDNNTQYNYEIEDWTDGSDRIVWVNVTAVDADADTRFLMYYGNSGASDAQSPTDVWDSSYVGVWHLNGTSGNAPDSTVYNNDVYQYGGVNQNSVGIIDGDADYDGVNDYMDVDSSTDFYISTMTVECWAEFDSATVTTDGGLISKTQQFYLYLEESDDNIRFSIYDDGGAWNVGDTGVGPATSWQYFVGTCDGTNIDVWINKTLYNNLDTIASFRENDFDVCFGNWESATLIKDFDGELDEVRISNIARNSSWLNACYDSSAQTSGFITWGDEQETVANVAPTLTNSKIYPLIGNNTDTFYFNVTYTDTDADVPGNITVNITDWGANWYSNNSMSWVSGDNITGAIFSYNTNSLATGDYNFTITADDGNGSANVKITPSLGAFSYSTLRNKSLLSTQGQYSQGVGTNGSFVYATSKTDSNTYPGTLNNFTNNGDFTNNQELELGGEVDHISDCYYYDGYVYVADWFKWTTTDYNTTYPYVVRYNAVDFSFDTDVLNDTSASTYLTEGVTFYDDNWWLCSHYDSRVANPTNLTTVRRYDSSWNFVADYQLDNGSVGSGQNQGLQFIEINNISYLFVTHHRATNAGLQIFRWNGSGFTELYWYGSWIWANQGLQINGSDNLDSVWVMNRVSQNANYMLEIDFNKASDTGIGPIVTTPAVNTAPTLSSPDPANGSNARPRTPVLSITSVDADGGDTHIIHWNSNTSGSWVEFATSSGSPGVFTAENSNFSKHDTEYYWQVNLTDGTDWVEEIYHFTTIFDINNTVASSPDPANGTAGVSISTNTMNITLADDSGLFNFTMTEGSRSDSTNGASNGTFSLDNNNFTFGQVVRWWVNVTDYSGNAINYYYEFTIETVDVNTAPSITFSDFANGSTITNDTTLLNFTIQDQNNSFLWTVQTVDDVGNNSSPTDTNGTKTCTIDVWNYWNDTIRIYVNATDYDPLNPVTTNRWYTFTVAAHIDANDTSPIVMDAYNEYPVNTSEIINVEPTLYFNLTNNGASTMDYRIYIGNTTEDATALISSVSGVSNGTFSHVNYHNASVVGDTYYWRVHYNDSTEHKNETFFFNTTAGGGGGFMVQSGNVIAYVGILFGGVALALLFILKTKRRRRDRY